MQVMQFWKKAERVMVYKRQSQLDARKKVAMDKHLSFLVGYLDSGNGCACLDSLAVLSPGRDIQVCNMVSDCCEHLVPGEAGRLLASCVFCIETCCDAIRSRTL